MFFLLGSEIRITQVINSVLSKEEMAKYNLKILYEYLDFKKDLENVCLKLKNTDNTEIYTEIINKYINSCDEKQFVELMNTEININDHKYLETNFQFKNHYNFINQLCQNIKFLIKILNNLNTRNISEILKNQINDIFMNNDYGFFSRISIFLKQHYKVLFYLNLLQIIIEGLKKNNTLSNETKADILFNFLKNNLNIHSVFNYDFLKINYFLNCFQFENCQNLKKLDKDFNFKITVIESAFNEIVFGLLQEEFSKKTASPDNFLLEIFDNPKKSTKITYLLQKFLLIIIKLSFPEEEFFFFNDQITLLKERFITNDNYFNSNFFITDIIHIFLRFIALSSLTSYEFFPEIFGKLAFNLPISNLIKSKVFLYKSNIQDVLSFIQSSNNVNIFSFFFSVNKNQDHTQDPNQDIHETQDFHKNQGFNKNKMIFILYKILEYRQNNTIFKIFKIYKPYLTSYNLEEIQILLNPKLT